MIEFTKTTFVDYPSERTPITAYELNKLGSAIEDLNNDLDNYVSDDDLSDTIIEDHSEAKKTKIYSSRFINAHFLNMIEHSSALPPSYLLKASLGNTPLSTTVLICSDKSMYRPVSFTNAVDRYSDIVWKKVTLESDLAEMISDALGSYVGKNDLVGNGEVNNTSKAFHTAFIQSHYIKKYTFTNTPPTSLNRTTDLGGLTLDAVIGIGDGNSIFIPTSWALSGEIYNNIKWERLVSESELIACKPHYLGNLTLFSGNWNNNIYTLDLSLIDYNVTENTRVDIQATETVYTTLISSGCNGIYVQNDNGIITVHAIGHAPNKTITIKLTAQEVIV